MPTGPKGEKRPPDPIACAVHVMKIATGEIEETPAAKPKKPAPPKKKPTGGSAAPPVSMVAGGQS